MKKIIFYLLVLFCLPMIGMGQTKTLTGSVTDAQSGESLPGVTVVVKGTQNGTQTDAKGEFVLEGVSKENVSLVFSYVGYQKQTVPARPGKPVRVALEIKTNSLDEVVAIGYGTTTRESLTGSVSSITGEDLKDIPVATVAEALAGRLAGVQVQKTQGSPGADVEIRVRGGNSITQDNAPLFIVDGIEMDNALSILSPSEIKSIDVLKDAASTAIYGSRGSNGVVLITTKSGANSRATVTYNAYFGMRKIVNKLPVMNPYDFVKYEYEQYNFDGDPQLAQNFQDRYGRWEDLDIYKNMPFRNWQDEIFGRNAFTQSHNVSLSGGNEKTKYYLNLGHFDEDGIMLGSGYKRDMASFKFSHKFSKVVESGIRMRYSRRNIDGQGTSNTGSQKTNRLRNAVRYRPFEYGTQVSNRLVFDPDYAKLTNLVNPLLLVQNEVRHDKRNDINIDGWLKIHFLDHFTLKGQVGGSFGNRKRHDFNGTVTSVARQNAQMPVVDMRNSHYTRISNSNTITYKNSFDDDHHLTVLAGEEIHQSKSRGLRVNTKWLPEDITADQAFAGIQKATPPAGMIQDAPSSSSSVSKLFSLFGRINYNYKSKYLLTLNFRHDGSSKFNANNRYGNFPSA
ncbi:MAG TPA: SusC/RagA family TonB-linked outer membrane protein, partial [Chitinophagaceae bacterium]|nr:SusC/RagA family TonB-linked outer membrane protein [Chitinophagaceae bacterium]